MPAQPEQPGQREDRVVVQHERAVIAALADHELPLRRGHQVDQVRAEQPAHRGLGGMPKQRANTTMQYGRARLDLAGRPQLDLVARLPDQRETGRWRGRRSRCSSSRLAVADGPGIRGVHYHGFVPAVDVALSPWPGRIAASRAQRNVQATARSPATTDTCGGLADTRRPPRPPPEPRRSGWIITPQLVERLAGPYRVTRPAPAASRRRPRSTGSSLRARPAPSRQAAIPMAYASTDAT